ncbi:ankyrin-2-like [Trichogramma pretiosum]|uniref:ankyrin-2-like n=1 Tax=Trichogramma pretiosum TaxID=7493 RepID=UPI0006C9CBB4|nr:ankyrin-2-like [Trichogramma pretiosum]
MIISEVMCLRYNQEKVDRLHRLREDVNWLVVSERNDFLVYLEPIINDWHNQLPNLLDIFRPEEIELLLLDCMNNPSPSDEEVYLGELFIEFVARCGYQDSLYAIDEKDKPTSRRTTPLHLAARCTFYNRNSMIPLLFKIYNRFDVNYDEDGLTHFHVACEYGCVDVVKNFLERGQDPDCLVPGTNDSPLHLAAKNSSNKKVITLLLNRGADSRRANSQDTTPIHIVCRYDDEEALQMLFENDQGGLLEAIDIQGTFGWTPLHTALLYANDNVARWLLERGADANSTNGHGETPLRVICKRRNNYSDAVKVLFEICDKVGQVMQVDSRNNEGLTPLQEAVVNLAPRTVAVLLNRGADLSSFVFPTEDHFTKSFRVWRHEYDFKLQLAAGLLCVVEQLEKRGYRLG